MQEDFYFVSYNVALMSAQVMVTHYALLGYHVNLATYTLSRGSYCDVTIFHDEMVIINPPKGFQYSLKINGERNNVYWTRFEFAVAD